MLTRLRFFFLLPVFMLLLATNLQAETILKAGDRIVVYGDSITEQRLYSRFLQQYLFVRYPELKLKVFNAGWGGDRAPGALGRLERDVLSLNPTIVTLFFGMNDGSYQAVNDTTVETYKKGMEGIITALQAKNVRVVVFTPGCVDPDRNKKLGDCNYNNTLETLGQAALDLARKYNCVSTDVIHPMLAYQTARKAENPGFTMIPDSVHPDPNGHLVMTNIMLGAFGVEPMPALATVDIKATSNEGVNIVTNTPDNVVLEIPATTTPFWSDPAAKITLLKSGLINLVGQKLIVKNLKEGTYALSIDGTRVDRLTSQELAAGYLVSGNYSARGKLLHDLIARKENNYFSLWRETRLALGSLTSAKGIAEGLANADDAYHAAIAEVTSSVAKTTITLALIPDGANLALEKTYVSSDPNKYGYGVGALTDGLWDAGHTFATGDVDAFPKNVTIDLEKISSLGSVIVGIPPFGSTKTVTVSVSADGKNFTDIGTYVFSQRKEERHTYTLPPTDARYVRLTYPDHYEEVVQFPINFSFTSEVEVYPPSKTPAAK